MFKKFFPGILFSFAIAVSAWFLGQVLPVIGAPIFAMLTGMLLAIILKKRNLIEAGIRFTSKKILQYAVILLGFGMNLSNVIKVGRQSLPIILSTIIISLLLSYILYKSLKTPANISILVGVGSSICGGSAIAATAPVIKASDEEIAQSMSVIFFFNVLAAIIFPTLGSFLGFNTTSGESFGIFAGTAINDTSSVTAAASTWDTLYNLGTSTLDTAVTVKLTRTLAIIPITLVLAFQQIRKYSSIKKENKIKLRNIFPFFILWFILASIITTITVSFGISPNIFAPLKTLSKFFIIMAMGAIGLNTNILKLIKTGGKPMLIGLCCWISITIVSLFMQYILDLI